jgi:hypothetical protein
MKDYKYLLLFRWMMINLIGVFLLGMSYFYGGIDLIIVADKTYLSFLIFGVFVYGLILSGIKIFDTSSEINFVKTDPDKSKWYSMIQQLRFDDVSSPEIVESLKLRLFSKISSISWFANSLVLMGLIGTVIGFIIALSGVDPTLVSDVSAIGKMVSTLISGLGTALYTTLVGSVLNLWLSANYRLISNGTATLMAILLEKNNV